MSPGPILSVDPPRATPGARVTLSGGSFAVDGPQIPAVRVQGRPARVVFATGDRLSFLVPAGLTEAGAAAVEYDGAVGEPGILQIAAPVATGLHQVDNPAFDRDGNLYVTYSGTRGQQVPVSIFRVSPSGTRDTYSSGIVNPTSMAFSSDGHLYVSSRFEGTVYRVAADGSSIPFATDLGVACGLAFADDGTLYVGDRSGTVFAVDTRGRATPFASLPSSVAAFHLALGPDALYVSAPTLSTRDSVYRVSFSGEVTVASRAFGRPQGLAFGPDRSLYVVEALAGSSGLYRLDANGQRELVLAAPGLVGVAFDRAGGLVVCSNETAFRLPRYH
jgi:sugar lactone lactonase YvrE